MTTVLPEAEEAVVAGQLPVKLGMRSLDVNAPGGSVAGVEAVAGGAEACEPMGGAGAGEDSAPEPVQDATRSSGSVMTAVHRRRRHPVRGVNIVLLL
jgi:hypothetical protein